ncbi:MAG: hypothetical protein FWE24_07085 [Defluviitaleaceae bacterium]|nr:hypothetical protein [Defluviitaleaceae bacterium]
MGKTTVYVLIVCIIVMSAFFIVMEAFKVRVPEYSGAKNNIYRSGARFVYIVGEDIGHITDNFADDFRKSRC